MQKTLDKRLSRAEKQLTLLVLGARLRSPNPDLSPDDLRMLQNVCHKIDQWEAEGPMRVPHVELDPGADGKGER